jgi:DNA-binding response OmpR family regulator
LANETILIIDDNADVRTLLGERVLPSYGYRTLSAPDGQEGLWQIRSHNPDLILLDLRLPDMTGIDLLHILSSEGYDTPVILITAYGSELIAAQALRLGVHDYIIKPFTLDEIVASVERALTETRLRRERNALNERLQSLNLAMRILADTGPEIVHQQDGNLQMCRVLEMTMAATRARSSKLWIHELEGYGLYLRAAQDRADQRAYLLRAGNPPAQVEQALALGTFQQWEEGQPGAQETCLATPIILTSWPAAVLEMHFPKEEVLPDDSRLLILRIAGNWLGMILEWGYLHHQVDALQRQNETVGALSRDLLLVLDEEETIVATTPVVEVMMGHRPASVVGKNFRQWVTEIELPQGEGEVVDWYLQQSGDERVSERYAFFFRGPQGEPRQAEVQVLVQQEEGATRRYLMFHDATAFNRLEQESRSLRHQLGEAMRGSPPGLLLVDLKGTILASDRAAEELLRLEQEALVGRFLWEALSEAEGSHLLPEEIARTYREGNGYAELHWPEKWSGPWGITLTLLVGNGGTPTGIVALAGPVQPGGRDPKTA